MIFFFISALAGGIPGVPALLPGPWPHGHGHGGESQRRHLPIRARIRSKPFRLRLPGQVHALSARPRRRLLPLNARHTGGILDLVHWKKKDD